MLGVDPNQIAEVYEDVVDDTILESDWSADEIEATSGDDIENFVLAMPSTLLDHDANDTVKRARVQEITLRIGQCNDALEAVRTEIARKVFVFKEHVRQARSKRYKFRAWTEIHAVDAVLRQAVSRYRQGRRALINLQASESVLTVFQPLLDNQLQAKYIFLDSHVRGVKHEKMPWFWTTNVCEDCQTDIFKREGELLH